ncbi:MAG: flagellar hook assembly protein FlgD [Phycisphaerae bacterium]
MSSISGYTQSSEDIRTDYLNLLITQLQHQNPMEPMSNDQMASQLATLSQLEQVESMNKKFDKVLMASQMQQATSMIGQDISYIPAGGEEAIAGAVDGAEVVDGQVVLNVNGNRIELEDVVGLGGSALGAFVTASDLAATSSLIGKDIKFNVRTASGDVVNITETVNSVEFVNGQIVLHAGDYVVEPGQVLEIQN